MTPGLWVLVAVAGAGGALLRHEVTSRAADGLVALHVVNVIGAAVLGVVLGAGPSPGVAAAAAGGLGGATSFSTWIVQARGRDRWAHVALPMGVAVAAALVGTLVGRALGASS